jgi:hypothetical protein
MFMPRTGSKAIKIDFSAGQLTHFGGTYLLHQFLQQLQFRTLLSRRLHLEERNNRYSLSERLLALIYPMILGLENVELTALLGTNGVFQYLTGLPHFPRPNTLRRFLLAKAPTLVPRVGLVHNSLRAYFLSWDVPLSSYWLDFDSTAKTLYGHQEGVVKGYNPGNKGKKSYHPLVCTEAHLGDCLGGELRFGNAHTATGVVEMFRRIVSFLPAGGEVRVRADAGFYDGDFIEEMSQSGAEFVVVAHLTRPLKDRLGGLHYQRINAEQSTAEFAYQPHGWKDTYRFVVLREKLTEKRKEQLKLFTMDAHAYHILVTNLSLTPWGVFHFYEDRAGMERIVRTLKDDYPFGSAPTQSFMGNALYAELSLLAYNIVIWFQRLCLPPEWQSYTVETLRHRLLLIPGVFTRTDNRPRLKLPKNSPYQNIYRYAEKKIKTLKPLVT